MYFGKQNTLKELAKLTNCLKGCILLSQAHGGGRTCVGTRVCDRQRAYV